MKLKTHGMHTSDSAADRFAFLDLAEDFFRELQVQPPPPRTFDDQFPLTLSFEVDGQHFELTHDPEPGCDHFVLECRFGSVPADAAVPALKRLLEGNAVLDPHGGIVFGIDEESGHVLCMRREPVQGTSASAMLDDLHAMAELAATWQQTWFLELPGPDNATSMQD